MTIGFIGTGTITAATVTGLCSPDNLGHTIRLSPRNPAVAAGLATKFENVSVCASNQEVLDSSETVVLAIRPQVAEEVLSGLRFSSRQNVISLVAAYPVRRIAELVQPAAVVQRAVPLPSAAQRRSPIAIYPGGGPAAELFGSLGQVFEVENEAHLGAYGAATSTMAAYFGFVGHIAAWLSRKGIPEQQSREYMARIYAGLAHAGMEASQRTYEELACAHATPGGLNEQLLRHLTDRGVFGILEEGLDAVYRRAPGQSASGS
jgi:pyrroline-5-carboxylate reductase